MSSISWSHERLDEAAHASPLVGASPTSGAAARRLDRLNERGVPGLAFELLVTRLVSHFNATHRPAIIVLNTVTVSLDKQGEWGPTVCASSNHSHGEASAAPPQTPL